MAKINILDNNTIDKIAAGEVVERPVSVVKELVENSIDAGADIITVEIRNGGLKLIRVTDNGQGIEADQIRKAFVSHATSKINDAEDLHALFTLGFRGEALSSISAVSRAEVTSRSADSLTGVHYLIEGGKEQKLEDVGAPVGTTFIVRDLFFNTLPRLKFLKSENTEASYIADMMEHLALSRPEISFQFINNGQTRFSTSGRGDLREVIYRLYGREMSSSLRYIDKSDEELSMRVTGFLGMPRINRSNRACEIFFINNRYVKSPLLSRAVEEGYIEYLMQHKFPFCILNFYFDPNLVDVNVHPTKQEVRITNEREVYTRLVSMISSSLAEREMVDAVDLNPQKEIKITEKLPEQFEVSRIEKAAQNLGNTIQDIDKAPVTINTPVTAKAPVIAPEIPISSVKAETVETSSEETFFTDDTTDKGPAAESKPEESHPVTASPAALSPELACDEVTTQIKDYEQLSYMDNERVLSVEARRQYRIIGQVFKTYWLIEYKGSLLIMDQHAAHEKVRFERLMSYLKNKKEVPSQNIMPPAVMTLANREKQAVMENLERFEELGFTIEDFGEHDIVIRAVPMDLYGVSPQDMITEIAADLTDLHKSATPDSIRSRIATQACKSAIKGNNTVSIQEVQTLLDEMLTLDNPYNCPHGRPTIITMTQSELEKRFHRKV